MIMTLTQLPLNSSLTYLATLGAAILSGSDPPISRVTILHQKRNKAET